MSDFEEPDAPLPGYVPPGAPSPVAAPPARSGLARVPVAVWVVVGIVGVIGLVTAAVVLLDTMATWVASGVDEVAWDSGSSYDYVDDYYYDGEIELTPVEIPQALSQQLARDYPTFKVDGAFEIEDNNHPGVPVYEVDMTHTEQPVVVTVRLWAPEGSIEPETVTDWGTTFPFFGQGEDACPFSEQMLSFVIQDPPDESCASAWFGMCRKTGEWGDIQAWTCECEWYQARGELYWESYTNGQMVLFVDTATGQWSWERPESSTTQ